MNSSKQASPNINVRIEICFTISNLINRKDLAEFYNNDLEKCVSDTLVDNGIFGVVEEEWYLTHVREK